MSSSPVLAAITGIGCICAVGDSLDVALCNLEANPPLPSLPERFPGIVGTHPVFQVRGDPKPSADYGLTLLWESTFQALSSAKLSPEALAGKSVGVCIGSSVGFAINYFPLYQTWREGKPLPKEALEAFRYSNYALALAKRLRVNGPCQLVANACASGTDAIGIGASWIASGLCDMVLAGGAESLSFISYLGFIRLMISDTEPCRPFDRSRSGLNLGEGSAIFLLEPKGTPRQSHGYVLGYCSASDAFHPTAPHPDGRGLKRAFATALKQAAVTSDEVAFVNAHGTGTQENDKVEGRVLGDMLPGVPVLATKGATGHTLGASGAIEAAITLGCLCKGTVPASPGFQEVDPILGVIPTTHPLELKSQIAVTNSLAFGGGNAVLVLEGKRP